MSYSRREASRPAVADSRRAPTNGYSAGEVARQQIDERNQACKSSLKNTLTLLSDTDRISQRTADKLNSQTEQLHRIHAQTENINDNLDHSQWVLQSMKSWWGRAKNSFTTPPKAVTESKENKEGKQTKGKIDAKDSKSSPRVLPPTHTAQRPSSSSTMRGPPASGNLNQNKDKLYGNRAVTQELSEEDRDMDIMLDMLDDIKERSFDIGRTIDSQNRLIHGIHENVDKADEKMARSQRDMKSLM